MSARALSIQQPWAWAITDLDKRVENRSKPTSFRGEVFLHASAQARPPGDLDCLTDAEARAAWQAETSGGMPRGAIVGVAELFSACTAEDVYEIGASIDGVPQSRWVEGPCCYLLHSVKKLPEPVPCRGMLGFWPVPEDVERAVRAQLQETDMPRKKKAETTPPAAEEAASNSPEDLGYKKGANGDDLPPTQRRELVRIAREIRKQSKDVDEKASARGSASKALQEAQKKLKRLQAAQNAVVDGTWQAGMFDEGEDEGEDEGGDDE